MAVKLIAGLGNPGERYAATRHNVGVWFINELLRQHNLTLKFESRFDGAYCVFEHAHGRVLLFQSSEYMNANGLGVAKIARFFKIPIDAILIAHDELDFPTSQIRLKVGGGHGGHNGLRDCIKHLQGDGFLRLRIGIDHPGYADDVTPYVLSKPPAKDREAIDHRIYEVTQLLDLLIKGDYGSFMNTIHTKTDE